MYRFATDSSTPNSTEIDTLWINQKRYNYFNVRFSAMFTPPEGLFIPRYVQRFKFGIVSGQIQVDLTKVDRNSMYKASKLYWTDIVIIMIKKKSIDVYTIKKSIDVYTINKSIDVYTINKQ